MEVSKCLGYDIACWTLLLTLDYLLHVYWLRQRNFGNVCNFSLFHQQSYCSVFNLRIYLMGFPFQQALDVLDLRISNNTKQH